MLVFEPIQAQSMGWLTSTVPVLRANIPGGWLVAAMFGTAGSGSLCFVPDPEHRWDGSSVQAAKAAK
jgi:hypothetical protein